MRKKEEVLSFIMNSISLDTIKDSILQGSFLGIDAGMIEDKLGIVRNNASTLLNALNKEGHLIKISGRPVRFIPVSILKDLFHNIDIKQEYYEDELKKMLLSDMNSVSAESEDPFRKLVGSDLSLKTQIDQAKAAIIYPPNGLHTLIIGPSGAGKTTFASIMYEYARNIKHKSKEDYPFISFNCSDYYNNPQLLLSQLFGHVKGAFTGAENDKIGLVEKANGGILFLDEVHRMPPDGQEMLFYLMDNGEYHRLGETDKVRKSNVLIIAATTEDPQEVLLETFLRRIPVIITLPSLSEKSIDERINIVETLFEQESVRINKELIVSPEVLKALVIYECKGNIGQLKSDIQQICAKAFLRHLQNKKDLRVEFDMLPKFIKDSVFNFNNSNSEFHERLNLLNEDFIFYPSKGKGNNRINPGNNFYEKIAYRLEELQDQGLSQEEINAEIGKEIEKYFMNMIRKFNYQSFNVRELYKVLDKEIVDFTIELITFASEKLNREINNKIMFGLAFHMSSLIERVKIGKPIVNHDLSRIRETYKKEYEVASLIVKKIEKKFNINIPIDENGFIAILLANNENENIKDDSIGILVIAHGNSTATSIANVCNRLLNSNFVKAIDMPLEKSVNEIYQKALNMVKTIDRGKGVIILVDMGSLKNFGKKITEETGIITRTIDKVSTPLVLEVLRKVMYKDKNIDEIYYSIVGEEDKKVNDKEKAIVTVCATGKGTSIMLKNMLYDILQGINNSKIKVIPINYMAIEYNTEEYQKIQNQYDIIAFVGNIKPSNDLPYFSMEEILNKNTKYKFLRFIESYIDGKIVSTQESSNDTSREVLENFTLYINPKKAIKYIEEFIKKLDFEDLNNNHSLKTNLIIHLGFMLERAITDKRANFENVEEFKSKNSEKFYKIRNAMKIFEEAYKIKITDDEICYAIQVINAKNAK